MYRRSFVWGLATLLWGVASDCALAATANAFAKRSAHTYVPNVPDRTVSNVRRGVEE